MTCVVATVNKADTGMFSFSVLNKLRFELKRNNKQPVNGENTDSNFPQRLQAHPNLKSAKYTFKKYTFEKYTFENTLCKINFRKIDFEENTFEITLLLNKFLLKKLLLKCTF